MQVVNCLISNFHQFFSIDIMGSFHFFPLKRSTSQSFRTKITHCWWLQVGACRYHQFLFHFISFLSVSFYFIPFHSVSFCFILFHSVLFCSIPFHPFIRSSVCPFVHSSILSHSVPFHSILFYSIAVVHSFVRSFVHRSSVHSFVRRFDCWSVRCM